MGFPLAVAALDCYDIGGAQKDHTMRTFTAERLRSAASEEDVVGIVRDYLGEWLPEELSHIPAGARPGKLCDAEDLNDVAYRLTRAKFAMPDDDEMLLQMQAFFVQACVRVAEINSVRLRARALAQA
jgi:hypothetical protein